MFIILFLHYYERGIYLSFTYIINLCEFSIVCVNLVEFITSSGIYILFYPQNWNAKYSS